nr:ABC transporter substrate-binding protein [uncultured Methanospirillum sp.]
MSQQRTQFWFSVVIIATLLMSCTVCVATASGSTKMITDMAGRQVTVPETINAAIGTAPPVTVMTYIIAPDKLVGFNSNYNSSKYLPDKYKNLPNIGGTQGQSKLNAESFFKYNPDVILNGQVISPFKDANSIDDIQNQLNPVPVIVVGDITNISNFAPGMTFLGQLYNNPEKAEEFNTFYENIYKKVSEKTASIPESERKKVYYAEGPEGLMTDPASSNHAQPLNVCNGINVADIEWTNMVGRTPVSIEQIMKWNPEVIIAADKQFYNKVFSDPNWAEIKAVKDKQVYLVPSDPFNWYDRSPGVNIVMGIPWTAKILYPDKFTDMDLKALTKEFYTQFYHYDMTDQEADDLLSASGIKA